MSHFEEGELEAFETDPDERTIEQQHLAYMASARLFLIQEQFAKIMQGLSAEDARKADRLIIEFLDAKEIHRQIESYRQQVNYDYWLTRCRAEREPSAVAARAAFYDAQKLIDETKIDRYVVVDEVTGERVEKDGAKQKYEQAFRLWAQIRNEHPSMSADSSNADDLIGMIQQYNGLLMSIGEDFPLDFPLQDLIDLRADFLDDGLPTSDQLELRRVNTLPSFSDRYGNNSDDATTESVDETGASPPTTGPSPAGPAAPTGPTLPEKQTSGPQLPTAVPSTDTPADKDDKSPEKTDAETPEESKSDESKSEESKSEEPKSEEPKSEEPKSEESKSTETDSDSDSEATPEDSTDNSETSGEPGSGDLD